MFDTPCLGTITIFAGSYAPPNWTLCQGQLISINSNIELYTLLGTTFGGDGQTTFALPDFRGRVPIHNGQGPGLSNYTPGEQGGAASFVLTVLQIPAHTHPVGETLAIKGMPAAITPGENEYPTTNYPAPVNGAPNQYSTITDSSNLGIMSSTGISGLNSGKGTGLPLMSPYVVMNYIICTNGLYPTHS
jgi:microcystin-dependent protein